MGFISMIIPTWKTLSKSVRSKWWNSGWLLVNGGRRSFKEETSRPANLWIEKIFWANPGFSGIFLLVLSIVILCLSLLKMEYITDIQLYKKLSSLCENLKAKVIDFLRIKIRLQNQFAKNLKNFWLYQGFNNYLTILWRSFGRIQG